MHTKASHIRFIELRSQGKSLRTIARELDIAVSTASAWNEKFSAQIHDAFKDRYDEVIEETGLATLDRLSALGASYKRLQYYLRRSENVKQDVRLYYLQIRLDKYINETYVQPMLEQREDDATKIINVISAIPRPDGPTDFDMPGGIYVPPPKTPASVPASTPVRPDSNAPPVPSNDTGLSAAESVSAHSSPAAPDDDPRPWPLRQRRAATGQKFRSSRPQKPPTHPSAAERHQPLRKLVRNRIGP